MKMSPTVLVVPVALLAFAASLFLFQVNEREIAIKLRFGEIVGETYEPGLHFRIPVANTIRKFERRLLTINNPQEQFLTEEKKNLYVDFFVKYRIADVGTFYRASQGEQTIAAQRVLEIVKDGIRAEFAKRTVPEVVSAERREIMDDMLDKARKNALELGIEVVDVRVKRIEFSDDVSESVFRRMREERSRIAAELRAEGAENAEEIRANADRQRTVMLAEAYRDSEILRGEGDATAADTYAQAYARDSEFYSFYRSIQAYRKSMGNNNDLLVISPDSEFLRYLNQSQPSR